MKILYFDTETTGTDPNLHEIVQFAAIIEINGKVVEEVDWRCRPTRWETISPEALQVTGLTLDELATYDHPIDMGKKLKALFNKYINKFDKADKFYPAGHNVGFDLDFLQVFWKKHIDKYGTGSYQNWRALDSRVFCNFLAAAGRLNVRDIKLSTLCQQFGIEIDAHDALSDIRATRQLIQQMLGALAYQKKEEEK